MDTPLTDLTTATRVQDQAFYRLYIAARTFRDGFMSQAELISAIDYAEKAEDAALAALEALPSRKPAQVA